MKAVLVTVDAPIPGKREADERIAAENVASAVSGTVASNDKKGGGLGRVMAKYIDSTLCWRSSMAEEGFRAASCPQRDPDGFGRSKSGRAWMRDHVEQSRR